MTGLRIAFFGSPQVAVPAFAALLAADDITVVVAVTNPDRPAGRGHKLSAPPVKAAAQAGGVEVWQPQRAREIRADLAALDVDACAVVAYGALLPTDVLAVGGKGFVNLHFSLLPAWRGAAPVQHTLLAGDALTGVTCFVLDAGMDTGDVLLRSEVAVEPDETAGELLDRLAILGAPELVAALRGLVDGSIHPVAQDHAQATIAGKITPQMAALNWTGSAQQLARAVRAYNPAPGAHTTFQGARLKVHRAHVAGASAGSGDPAAAPGTIIRADPCGPVVACGQGLLCLDQVQPAGKARMQGRDFANGYRPVGAVLGD